MQATGGSLLDRVARLLAPPRPLSRASRGLASLVVVGTLGLALGVGSSLLRGAEWPSGTIHASMPTASDSPKHIDADDLATVDEAVTKNDDAVTDEQCEKEPVVVADASCDECVDEPHVHDAESADLAEGGDVDLDVTAEVSADSRWADHGSFDFEIVPPVPPTPVVAVVPSVAAMPPHPPVPLMAPPALVPPVPMSVPPNACSAHAHEAAAGPGTAGSGPGAHGAASHGGPRHALARRRRAPTSTRGRHGLRLHLRAARVR